MLYPDVFDAGRKGTISAVGSLPQEVLCGVPAVFSRKPLSESENRTTASPASKRGRAQLQVHKEATRLVAVPHLGMSRIDGVDFHVRFAPQRPMQHRTYVTSGVRLSQRGGTGMRMRRKTKHKHRLKDVSDSDSSSSDSDGEFSDSSDSDSSDSDTDSSTALFRMRAMQRARGMR